MEWLFLKNLDTFLFPTVLSGQTSCQKSPGSYLLFIQTGNRLQRQEGIVFSFWLLAWLLQSAIECEQAFERPFTSLPSGHLFSSVAEISIAGLSAWSLHSRDQNSGILFKMLVGGGGKKWEIISHSFFLILILLFHSSNINYSTSGKCRKATWLPCF